MKKYLGMLTIAILISLGLSVRVETKEVRVNIQNEIGVATAIAECEDNSPENGYYMYCETKEGENIFVPMEDVLEGDTFVYEKDNNKSNVLTILEMGEK